MAGSQRENLTGRTFGQWTVLDDNSTVPRGTNRRARCKCSCGRVYDIQVGELRSGRATRCKVCAAQSPTSRAAKKSFAESRVRDSDGSFLDVGETVGKRSWRCPECGAQYDLRVVRLKSERRKRFDTRGVPIVAIAVVPKHRVAPDSGRLLRSDGDVVAVDVRRRCAYSDALIEITESALGMTA